MGIGGAVRLPVASRGGDRVNREQRIAYATTPVGVWALEGGARVVAATPWSDAPRPDGAKRGGRYEWMVPAGAATDTFGGAILVRVERSGEARQVPVPAEWRRRAEGEARGSQSVR